MKSLFNICGRSFSCKRKEVGSAHKVHKSLHPHTPPMSPTNKPPSNQPNKQPNDKKPANQPNNKPTYQKNIRPTKQPTDRPTDPPPTYHIQFTNCLRVPSPISEALTFTSIDKPTPAPLFNAISNETLWQKLTAWFIDSPPLLRLLDPHSLALGILDWIVVFPQCSGNGLFLSHDLEKPEAATVSNVRNCVQSRL